MATLSSDGKYVTVVRGDTLSEIAQKYKGNYGYTSTTTYMNYLVKLNDIDNPNLIYVGQKIKLTGTAAKKSKNTSSKKATIKHFGLQSNTDRTIFATWTWNNSNTDRYQTRWYYSTGDGVWFIGADNDSTTAGLKQDTYSAPSNAKQVKFYVKPVSKTKTVKNSKGKETKTSYWTADWSTAKVYTFENKPEAPPTPTVTIEKNKLTAELDNLDTKSPNGTHIQFQVVKDDGAKAYKSSGNIKIVNTYASYTCTVASGGEYKVRCRAIRGKLYSEWSAYTANVECVVPSPVKEITQLYTMESGTVVFIDWDHVKNVDSYEVEYTTKKYYFDSSNSVQSTTVDAKVTNHAEITGLETGQEYFFRVRSVKGEEKSEWTAIKSIKVGTKPAPPTTWSSSTTVVTGEKLTLYWVHNSEDGSSQTEANLEIKIGSTTNTYTIANSTDPDKKDKTSSYSVDTSSYASGTTIKWRVRTKGIVATYSNWSTQRTITIHAQPQLSLVVTKTDSADGEPIGNLESFPFYIRGYTEPSTQKPIGYNVDIISEESYETVDELGNVKMVKAGESVYSKYIPSSTTKTGILWARINADNTNLENNMVYRIRCVASMNSGLTAEADYPFAVEWSDIEYEPNAEISIDEDTLAAVIRPYCVRYAEHYYAVSYNSDTDEYTVSSNEINERHSGTPLDDIYTVDGYQVYSDYDTAGNFFYYCVVEEETQTLVKGVTLSVYRREFDGSFIEIATGLKNTWATYVLDPHPALDYARYRIVATTTSTGAVGYSDISGYPVGESSIVIQWDEEWSEFDVDENNNAQESHPWTGSMLKLPYNIDISDSANADVELVEYIGRENPVSYYGTQIGYTATWNATIDKEDKDTLYALRRLQRYMGDVYVREPSGSGYWANIKVSFNQKHLDLTIPVTLNVTRVEGGA